MKIFFNASAWRAGFVLLLCAWLLGSGLVDAATYAYRNDTFAYDTPSGSAATVAWHASGASPACTSYPNGDDDWADVAFPGGFAFTFGGVSYSQVRVYSNGILAFGNDVSGFHRDYTPQALPAPAASQTYVGCPNAAPVNVMLPYWTDIVAGTANNTAGASVQYELLGTAPNRRFVISWVNVKLYGTSTRYNFQVALYESAAGVNGNFKYQYTSGSSNGANATVGVQLSQTDYTQYAYNQAFIDTTVGTAILWYPANQLATKGAEYRFDESAWTGVAGEVKDTSGNSQDASRVGAAANVVNGKLCRGGGFTNNTSNTIIDAVATPIVPGNQGSLDFWFNSNAKWNSTAAMLFDASTVANRPFFLMKSATGALTFVVSDSAGTAITATAPAQTFASSTWHHVGVSWNVRVGTNQTTLQIFLDGVLQNGAPKRGTTNGTMPALGSIYIGDNRTSGVTPSGGTPNGANAIIDEVYVYAIEISAPQAAADMNLTRPTCTALDHFHIIHDGTVSGCTAPASITIEAHDANHALFSLAGTSINLSTTPAHGTWSNVSGGAINPLTAIVAGTGTASYTFANESRVTFGLSDNLSESLNINVASGTVTEHTGTAAICVAADYTTGTVCDASRAFVCAVPFGFNCVESGADALSGRLYTKLAGAAFSFDVVALKDANGDGVADAVETAYASDADKSVTVELVEGSGNTACASRAAISPAVSQTLTFTKANQPTEQGRKAAANMTVTKAYTDLRCRVTDANQSPSIIACSSDDFSARPSAVTLNVSPAMATPPSASATPTIKAGASFTLTATTTSGTNYAGALAQDTAKLTAQTTTQDTTVQSGGTVGTLAPATLTANASPPPSNNAAYTEVGYLYLAPGAFRDDSYTSVDQPSGCAANNSCDCVIATASDANLADTIASGRYGCSIGNKTNYSFGRFIPDHFKVAAGTAIPACGTFTYLGQDGFTTPFTLTAQNVANETTQNYAGKFGRLDTTVWSNFAFSATGLPSGSSLTASATAPSGSWSNGEAAIIAKHQITRPASPVAPASVIVSALPVDSDGVTMPSAVTVQTVATELRYGRLRLQNAYGSELLDLPVPLEAQYWTGNYYVTNTADNCTVVPASSIIMNNYLKNLNACETQLSPAGDLVFTGGLPSPGVKLTKPGLGNAGSVNLTVNISTTPTGKTCIGVAESNATAANIPWFGANPASRATFGIYKTPIIYMRENY
ncbi:MAG: DUF6701 domain-containing protein [Sulfurimicrobium sp.]